MIVLINYSFSEFVFIVTCGLLIVAVFGAFPVFVRSLRCLRRS